MAARSLDPGVPGAGPTEGRIETDVEKLLLLKLICCGGLLLILLAPWAALSGAIALLGDGVWYLVGAAVAAAGVLVWRSRWGRRARCGIGRPGSDAAIGRQRP